MQALIATSRSISQDPFHQKQSKRKYQLHVSKVTSIKGFKEFPILQQAKQVQRMTKTMHKYKQTAKTFRQHQQKNEIKKQNRLLLQKIWKINSNIKTDSDVLHLQYQSGSNWNLKKKQAQTIKQQNVKFINQLMTQKADIKQYKKKLQHEIKQYLDLKKNIRKFDYETQKKKNLKRTHSEKKGFILKLKIDDEDPNNQIENHKKDTKILLKNGSKKSMPIKLILKNQKKQQITQNKQQISQEKQEIKKQQIVIKKQMEVKTKIDDIIEKIIEIN